MVQDTLTVVLDYFNKKQWDTNIPEVMNYAEAVAEQLNRDPDWIDGNYTIRDWYRDTYRNYPEEIEWLDSTTY